MVVAALDVLGSDLRWQHLADIVPSPVRVLHDQQRARTEADWQRQQLAPEVETLKHTARTNEPDFECCATTEGIFMNDSDDRVLL